MNIKKKPRKKRKNGITPRKRQWLRLNEMWAQLVRARDGYESVLSGCPENLCSHHIVGKKGCYHWWSIDGGITLTVGEHGKTHGHFGWNDMEIMRKKIINYLGGADKYDALHEKSLEYYKEDRDDTEVHLNELANDMGVIWQHVVPEAKYKRLWADVEK